MKLTRISVKNFRNIKEAEIFPDPGMNVICGENAQGKTNFLEAIWLFCGAKSFRGSKENDFIMMGEKTAQNEADFIKLGAESNAVMKFSEKRTAYLNGKPLQSPAKLAGNFSAVVFSPSDLSLIKDGPSVRRRFIDTAIGQLYPNYIEILKNYHRAVMQRNKIIKEYRFDKTLSVMLDVFEKEICQSGEKIMGYRNKYLLLLDKYFPEIYSGISCGREEIRSLYVANCRDITEEKLKEARKEDMYSGVTSIGPHRDDIEFFVNGINARSFGSQGQQRSIALSLKFSQAEVSREISGEYPVCLLDDVMSELDPKRQNYILNHIMGWQSFITCCDPLSTERLREGKITEIKNGKVI